MRIMARLIMALVTSATVLQAFTLPSSLNLLRGPSSSVPMVSSSEYHRASGPRLVAPHSFTGGTLLHARRRPGAGRGSRMSQGPSSPDLEGYSTKRATFEPQSASGIATGRGAAPWPNYYCSPLNRSETGPGDKAYALVYNGENLVRDVDGQPEAVFLTEGEARAFLDDPGSIAISLGTDDGGDGQAFFALDVSNLAGPPRRPEGEMFAQLRSVGGILSKDTDAGILGHARGMAVWHRSFKFCSKCGSGKLSTHRGGAGRKCGGCSTSHYPRIDPSMIALITTFDGGKALLGRKKEWPEGQYSTLAGFTEMGESLEETIVREVAEESGVVVDKASIAYRTSQPWPFPRSLMIAFTAKCTQGGGEIKVDEKELEDVRWFSRDEVMRAVRGETGHGGPLKKIPGRSAVARTLISEWAQGAGK